MMLWERRGKDSKDGVNVKKTNTLLENTQTSKYERRKKKNTRTTRNENDEIQSWNYFSFFAMSVVLVVFIYTLILWSAQHWCSSWIWIISTYYWIRSSWWKILQLILCINLLCFFSFRFVLFCFNTLMTYGPNVIRTFFFLGKIRIFENK